MSRRNTKTLMHFQLPTGDIVRFDAQRRPALGLALRDERFRADVQADFESLLLASERLAGEPELRAAAPSPRDLERLRDGALMAVRERRGRGELGEIDAAAGLLLDADLGRASRERFVAALDEVIARAFAAGDRETALGATASVLGLLAGFPMVPAVTSRLLHCIGALVEPPPAPLQEPTAMPPRRLHRYAGRVRARGGQTKAMARHLMKGTRLFQQGFERLALDEFQKAYLLAETPHQRLAPLLECARCHFRLEQREAALAALRKARGVAAEIPPLIVAEEPARLRQYMLPSSRFEAVAKGMPEAAGA